MEALLDEWAGFTGFIDIFLTPAELSLAMPAVTTLDLPADGDTGSGGSPGELTMTQVQDAMLALSSWSRAPYMLACSDPDDAEVAVLEQCQVGHPAWTAADLVPAMIEAASVSLSPTSPPGLALPPEVEWTMYAGPNLVSSLGRVQLRRPSAFQLLRCGPDATDPDCLDDTDADGHPDQGDCAPLDATTHPLWISPDEDPCTVSTTDHNCDDWTCPPP